MGKAKWWVCGGCHSLNDLPANKCYKCREPKPNHARTLDDEYAEVGAQQRVGITVDLSKVGDLTRPDPVAEQRGGGLVQAFGAQDPAPSPAQPAGGRHDPDVAAAATGTASTVPQERPGQPSVVAPIREPVRRGIVELGGAREWAGASPLSGAQSPPPPGQVRPGQTPPLGPAQAPPPGPGHQPAGAPLTPTDAEDPASRQFRAHD